MVSSITKMGEARPFYNTRYPLILIPVCTDYHIQVIENVQTLGYLYQELSR
jgi:hypothetical protein